MSSILGLIINIIRGGDLYDHLMSHIKRYAKINDILTCYPCFQITYMSIRLFVYTNVYWLGGVSKHAKIFVHMCYYMGQLNSILLPC